MSVNPSRSDRIYRYFEVPMYVLACACFAGYAGIILASMLSELLVVVCLTAQLFMLRWMGRHLRRRADDRVRRRLAS